MIFRGALILKLPDVWQAYRLSHVVRQQREGLHWFKQTIVVFLIYILDPHEALHWVRLPDEISNVRGGFWVRLLNLIDCAGRLKFRQTGRADDTVLELFGGPLASHQTQTGRTLHLVFQAPPKKVFWIPAMSWVRVPRDIISADTTSVSAAQFNACATAESLGDVR